MNAQTCPHCGNDINAQPFPTAMFEKCITRSVNNDGWYQIKCRLNLWFVPGRTSQNIEADARNLWLEYYHAGAYNELLNEKHA